jgi:hypothetical protein
MGQARIFENEAGEWFIDWANPDMVRSGPWYSEGAAIAAYRRYCNEYGGDPSGYSLEPYSEPEMSAARKAGTGLWDGQADD